MRIRSNKGFTLIELLIVVAIIGIIAAIAVPGLLRARMAGNEASAIGSLRAINSSQQAFASACSNGMYAINLTTLGTPALGTAAAPFISPDLGASNLVSKSGFDVTLGSVATAPGSTPDNCQGLTGGASQTPSYYAFANATGASTGSRNFYTNTAGTVFWQPQATAYAADNEIAAPSAGVPIQ